MSINWNDFLTADFEAGSLNWKRRDRQHFMTERSWKIWNIRFADKVAGYAHPDGYWQVSILGKKYLSHRILWEMAHGPIPAGMQVDHISQNKSNSALSNLRLATNQENSRNRGVNTNNTSGVKGVHRLPNGRLVVWINDIFIGRFNAMEDAISARRAAELKYHGEFAPR